MSTSLSFDPNDSLLSDFLDEAGELLDRLNENLLSLDEWAAQLGEGEARCDDALMTDMFRSAHSIKGLSGMLGLTNTNQLTHKIENVFDAARKNELVLRSNVVQAVFQGVDQLSALIDNLRDNGSEDLDCSSAIDGLQQVLVESGCARGATSQVDAERERQTLLAQGASPPELTPESTPTSVQTNNPKEEEIDWLDGIEDDDEIQPKYLAIFIDEADLSLDELTETLLHAESYSDRAALETLLCTAHRIKGSAASIGLNRAAKLAHLMEDSLQELREKCQPLGGELADVFLKCTDSLRAFVAELKIGNVVDCAFSENARLIARVRSASERADSQEDSNAPQPLATSAFSETMDGAAARNSNVGGKDEPSWLGSARFQLGEGPTLAGRVVFEPHFPLVGLKAQLLVEKLAQLGEIRYCEPAEKSLDDVDSLEQMVFVLACRLSPEAVAEKLRISGVARVDMHSVSVHDNSLVSATSSPHRAPSISNETKSAVAKESPDFSHRSVAPMPNSVATAVTAVKRGEPAPSGQVENDAPAMSADASKGPAESGKPTETLRVDIERLDELMNLAGQLVISRARFSQIDQKLRESQPSKNVRLLAANLESLAEQMLVNSESSESDSKLNLEQIRSHAHRMHADMAIVRRELEQLSHFRSHLQELGEAVHQLDRVSEGIQKSVMDTRMVPVGPLFTRFRRVIRDISRTNGKQIELVIKGEKTELDKRMIDELGDPLVHMVRNSADHGIESPEQREAAGKPKQGAVTLDACHRGNSILITVSDDGKGLDRQRILAKALERKLISPADAENLTPHEIHQLIWLPGFSTAEKVTDISGRGMGMDIVRSKIEELNGTVEIFSEPGQGTKFVIRLPLTLAILPSLLSRIRGDVYAMPIESVVEIVSYKEHATRTVHGERTTEIRGRVISVVDLDTSFEWQGPSRAAEAQTEKTLVVISSDRREVGLLVDSVLGEDDIVIKSIAENYRNVPGIAGASILGDGRVALILDIPTVIEMATVRQNVVG